MSIRTSSIGLLLFLVISLSSWPQDSIYDEGIEIISSGDRAALEPFLLGKTIPIRMTDPVGFGPGFYPEPLVVEAIRAGKPEMVEVFLDRGLSVGIGTTRDG